MSEKDSTTGLKVDKFPDDKEKWDDLDEVNSYIEVGIVASIVLLILISISIYYYLRKRKQGK